MYNCICLLSLFSPDLHRWLSHSDQSFWGYKWINRSRSGRYHGAYIQFGLWGQSEAVRIKSLRRTWKSNTDAWVQVAYIPLKFIVIKYWGKAPTAFTGLEFLVFKNSHEEEDQKRGWAPQLKLQLLKTHSDENAVFGVLNMFLWLISYKINFKLLSVF